MITTIRKVRSNFGRNKVPNPSTVKRIIEKFERTGSVSDAKHTTRARKGRSEENIMAVRKSVAENLKTSIRHRAQELNITVATLQRILTKDLHLYVYKMQLSQQLLPADHAQRATGLFSNKKCMLILCTKSFSLMRLIFTSMGLSTDKTAAFGA